MESPERDLQEMSLDMFRQVTMRMQCKIYALLGGEPLLHSKIDDIFSYCQNSDICLAMLSNITVNHDIVVNAVKNYKKVINTWLINSDYTVDQRDLFLENFITIINARLGEEPNFCLATTLLPREGAIDANIERLSYIIKRVPKSSITDIRLSTTTPTHNKIFKLYDYTKDAEKLIKALRKLHNEIHFHFDCSPCGCEIQRSLTDRYVGILKRSVNFCNTPVADVMPDGKVYWCSSATFLYLDNIFDYHSEEEVTKALQAKWREYWEQQSFSEECRNCGYLKPDICFGYCAAKHHAIHSDKYLGLQ